MDVLKGIGVAILIAVALVCLPIILTVIGGIMTVLGPVAALIILIGLPFIALGVIIGAKQKKSKD